MDRSTTAFLATFLCCADLVEHACCLVCSRWHRPLGRWATSAVFRARQWRPIDELRRQARQTRGDTHQPAGTHQPAAHIHVNPGLAGAPHTPRRAQEGCKRGKERSEQDMGLQQVNGHSHHKRATRACFSKSCASAEVDTAPPGQCKSRACPQDLIFPPSKKQRKAARCRHRCAGLSPGSVGAWGGSAA